MLWRITCNTSTPSHLFSLVWKIRSISVYLATWIYMVFKRWENMMVGLSLKKTYKKSFELYDCHDNFHLDKTHTHTQRCIGI